MRGRLWAFGVAGGVVLVVWQSEAVASPSQSGVPLQWYPTRATICEGGFDARQDDSHGVDGWRHGTTLSASVPHTRGEDMAREVDCRTDLKTTKGTGVVTSPQHITPQFCASQTLFSCFKPSPAFTVVSGRPMLHETSLTFYP